MDLEAVLELTHRIHNSIDNKKHTIAIFTDLSKAFDVINHSILLKKRGLPLKWVTNYLTDREQITVVSKCE